MHIAENSDKIDKLETKMDKMKVPKSIEKEKNIDNAIEKTNGQGKALFQHLVICVHIYRQKI